MRTTSIPSLVGGNECTPRAPTRRRPRQDLQRLRLMIPTHYTCDTDPSSPVPSPPSRAPGGSLHRRSIHLITSPGPSYSSPLSPPRPTIVTMAHFPPVTTALQEFPCAAKRAAAVGWRNAVDPRSSKIQETDCASSWAGPLSHRTRGPRRWKRYNTITHVHHPVSSDGDHAPTSQRQTSLTLFTTRQPLHPPPSGSRASSEARKAPAAQGGDSSP